MKPLDLLIRNARQLLTIQSSQKGPRTKERLEELGIVQDGAIAVSDGKIVAVGKTQDVLKEVKVDGETKVIDAATKVVLPGFVDCHTHPVFAATREEEFDMRVRGKSYQEIAAAGGGIKSSVKALRSKSKQELIEFAVPYLDRLLSYGTTTIEAKSGYGLSLEDEIKMLEVIRKLNHRHPIDLIPTFLGAHEVPPEYKDKKSQYVDLIINEMIPEVAKRKLAVFCDIFCEKGVFDIEESRRILTAAKKHGFKLKLHADQLSALGGSKLAAELGATSADHLEFVDDEGIRMVKDAGVIGVLLPGACFGLGMREYPPARKMIGAGLPVALATDFNPGSSFTESMPMIMSLACLMMRMTPAEAVTASTINSAYAIDEAGQIGSIEVGKKADLVIWNIRDYREIPYHYGVNLIDQVIKDGRVIEFSLPSGDRDSGSEGQNV
jgi:imidazolonepropionase